MGRRELAKSAVVALLLLGVIVGVNLRCASALRRAEEAAQPKPSEPPIIAGHFPGFRIPEAPPDHTPDEALASGIDYLIKQQSPDGAWRSDVYATFRDGAALTPLVVCALQETGEPGASAAAVRKGCEYLAKLIKADGTTEGGEGALDYPAYTAALAVKALSHPDQKDLLKARDAWLKYLLDRQLTEKLGWKPEDKQYGGWGYCRLLPKKPEPNTVAPPLIESNLSATVFALEALQAAGVKDVQVYRAAERFLKRCQNEDGGFYFIYDDPVRNKAGGEGGRFHSYGSTTADGVRGLQIIGTEPARIESATQWLVTHFRADTHPGKYVPAHERNREAVYFYYAASVSKALRAAKVTEAGGKPWAEALSAELVKRQKADGSWANPVELVRENEPLVATANAIIALANCKAAMRNN